MSKYNPELYRIKANLCKTLADPRRQMIISELRDGEKTVSEISEAIGTPQPATSHHLAILRDRGVVIARRDGANVFYSLANPRIIEACDIVQDILISQMAKSKEFADRVMA